MNQKQAAWLEEFLKDFNATRAAEAVGYKHPNKYGPDLKLSLAEEIAAEIEARKMTDDEVDMRYAEKARFDLSPYITTYGKLSGVDLEALIADGHGHMIRKIKHTKYGTEIEFADQDHALDMIAKAKGMFVNKTELSGPDGGPVPIRVLDYGFDDADTD